MGGPSAPPPPGAAKYLGVNNYGAAFGGVMNTPNLSLPSNQPPVPALVGMESFTLGLPQSTAGMPSGKVPETPLSMGSKFNASINASQGSPVNDPAKSFLDPFVGKVADLGTTYLGYKAQIAAIKHQWGKNFNPQSAPATGSSAPVAAASSPAPPAPEPSGSGGGSLMPILLIGAAILVVVLVARK